MARQDKKNDSFVANAKLATENSVDDDQKDVFWVREDIDAARWNASYPYQLLVVKQSSDTDGNISYIQDTQSRKFKYTFPFAPDSLQESWPFAIDGGVTQGGYVEQHNGIPIRSLTFSGTTGVLPLRGAAPSRQVANFAEGVFAGTIQNAGRVVNAVSALVGNFGPKNTPPNLVDPDLFTRPIAEVAAGSGYYQMRMLRNFFETYATLKKESQSGKDYRLAFAMWKDQQVYLVRPVTFTISKDASSPMEQRYTIGFEAWRRIKLDNQPGANTPFRPVMRDANLLAKSLKSLEDARLVLNAARDTIAAVAGDIDHALFEPLRETVLFIKDALGVPVAFADLPAQILTSAKSAIVSYIAVQDAGSGFTQSLRASSKAAQDDYTQIVQLAATTSKSFTGDGSLPQSSSSALVDVANDPFNHPEEHYELFAALRPSQMNLPPITTRVIVGERERIRKLTRFNFESARDNLVRLQADFADLVGAGNATYATTIGRPYTPTTRTPTSSDFRVMFALNRAIMELNRLAVSSDTNRFKISAIEFMAGLHSRSGIAFKTPVSKFAVPFPYAHTLEQVAQLYLGNPDRWGELVALNGLRSPYVDEVGFDLPLLTNGRGNQLSVAPNLNLYIGQQVWLSSGTTARTLRRITSIKTLDTSTMILTLDGLGDLDRFSTLSNATLHAFLPDTVNSMMTLYIPSDQKSAVEDYRTKAIPGLNQFDSLLSAGGFDLLLTNTGDLAITPDGDCRLAIGLTNIIQTARTRLALRRGSLNRHPGIGIDIEVGQSVADLDASQLLASVKGLFDDDPTFTGVSSAAVQINGPGVKIALQVGVQGQPQDIPITLNIR